MNIMKNAIYGFIGLFYIYYYVVHSNFMEKMKKIFFWKFFMEISHLDIKNGIKFQMTKKI